MWTILLWRKTFLLKFYCDQNLKWWSQHDTHLVLSLLLLKVSVKLYKKFKPISLKQPLRFLNMFVKILGEAASFFRRLAFPIVLMRPKKTFFAVMNSIPIGIVMKHIIQDTSKFQTAFKSIQINFFLNWKNNYLY